jgi:hypothetical protein
LSHIVTLIVAMRHLSTVSTTTVPPPPHADQQPQRRRGGEWEIRETTALAGARDSSASPWYVFLSAFVFI